MNSKIIIPLILFIIAVPLSVFLFLKLTDKSTPDNRPVSKNILSLTTPIMSFSGTVDKVDGNIITLTQVLDPASPTTPPTVNLAIPPSPTPTPSPLTYQVIVSEQTQISRPPTNFFQYLFRDNPPTPPESLSLADVKVGIYLMANSKEDLRTIQDDSFEATLISLFPQITDLNGKITAISSNAIIVEALAPIPPYISTTPTTPEVKEYTITVTPDTEISRMIMDTTLTTLKPEKLSPSYLAKDMEVTVYTDADVTNGTQFTALRIEPITAP